jgi:malate dehydrogenase (decarboxylating)
MYQKTGLPVDIFLLLFNICRLASYMKEEEVQEGIIYPPISRFYNSDSETDFPACVACLCLLTCTTYRIRDITKEVAAAVVREAVAENLAEGYRDMDARELAKLSEVVNLFTPQANYIMPLWFYHGLLC